MDPCYGISESLFGNSRLVYKQSKMYGPRSVFNLWLRKGLAYEKKRYTCNVLSHCLSPRLAREQAMYIPLK